MEQAAVRDRRHPLPRPDAECSPGRGHVHHDACRCDGTRKTIPGWEYQFIAAVGHLRTAWAALIDAGRTTPAARTRQTARQVRNLLRRLRRRARQPRGAAGHLRRRVQRRRADRRAGRAARAPAGPAARQQRLLRRPGHLARQTRPGPAATASPSPATTIPSPRTPNRMNPHPPGTRTTAPSASMPGAACTPSSTATAAGSAAGTANCPSCAARCCASWSTTCPTAAATQDLWLWHAGPAPLSPTSYGAPTCPVRRRAHLRFLKGSLGLTAAEVRTPGQADRWVRLVMAAYAQLLIARHRRPAPPLGKTTRPGRPLTPGRVRWGFPSIRRHIGTPAHVAKPARPGPGRPKGTTRGPAPRRPIPKKSRTKNK